MQGDADWLAQRAGFFTASKAGLLLVNGKGKGGMGAGLESYCIDLATERMTGEPVDNPNFAGADWGHEMEAAARVAYEVATGNLVTEVDFIKHPALRWVGCSPDGLIGEPGGLELKCPMGSAKHTKTLLDALADGGIPKEHMPQVQFCLFVTGREWWDFGSYDPRALPHRRLYTYRVLPDPAIQAKFAERLGVAEARVQEIITTLEVAA